jgi:hypothetical protein
MTLMNSRFLVLAAMLVSGCGDTVERRYDTRVEAEADQLFQRGWLPELIPQSSYDIRIENDLDINVSEGEFSFFPGQAKNFTNLLVQMDASELSGTDAARFIALGYSAHAYRDESSWWMFFVNSEKGHCEYRMGLR